MNMIEATLDKDGIHIDGSGQHLALPGGKHEARKVILGIRLEDIHLADPDFDFVIEAAVDFAELTRPNVVVFFRLNSSPIIASLPPHSNVAADALAKFSFSRRDMHLFDGESGKRINI